jgi:hypothetical protein
MSGRISLAAAPRSMPLARLSSSLLPKKRIAEKKSRD